MQTEESSSCIVLCVVYIKSPDMRRFFCVYVFFGLCSKFFKNALDVIRPFMILYSRGQIGILFTNPGYACVILGLHMFYMPAIGFWCGFFGHKGRKGGIIMRVCSKLFLYGFCAMMVGVARAEVSQEDLQKKKTVTSQYYVETQLATKQPAIGPQSGNYVVMYPDSTADHDNNGTNDIAGEIYMRHVATSLSVGSTPDNVDNVQIGETDIPTVGAVNTGLSGKQDKLSNTSGKLVTYGASSGSVTATDVYNSGSAYAGQTSALARAQDVNGAVVNGFGGLLSCAEWEVNTSTGVAYTAQTDPDNEHCLTWLVNTNMASGTYVPQQSGS